MDARRWSFVLAVVLAFAAGWLVNGISARSEPRETASRDAPSPTLASAGQSPTDRGSSDVVAELRGLRADLLTAWQQARTREPASSAASTGSTELVAALKDLTAALHDQPVRGERAGAGLGVRRVPSAAGLSTLDELVQAKDQEQLSRSHRFWTLQDLIDRYGQPASFNPQADGILQVWYSAGENRFRSFSVYNGQVLWVN
jgi:hypothetical protein